MSRTAARVPRVQALLDPPVYRVVSILARRERVSMSRKVADLVKQALESLEDEGLEILAEERTRTFDRKKALSHDALRRRLGLS